MFHGQLPQVKGGYSIEEVPIGLKSDSVIAPDSLLRPTQTNIGHFLESQGSGKEKSFGIHKTEYGGIGGEKLYSSNEEEFVVRKGTHIRTGVHGIPEPPINKRCMANRVKRNEGLITMDINKFGNDIFKVSRTAISEPLPKLAQKQLFPRSVVFEVEYAKSLYQKAMLEALERERAEFEKTLQEKKAGVLKKSAVNHNIIQEQVLDEQKETEHKLPSKRSSSYSIEEKQESGSKCASVCGTCGCTLKRGKCSTCFEPESEMYTVQTESTKGWNDHMCMQWPNKEPKYITPWGSERKAELMRVGYPFATEAATWLYCTVPPFDMSKFYRPSKKRFPGRSFSSLNI